MITKDDVRKDFLTDLCAVLRKYGAEITIENFWTGYAECGEDTRMIADIPAVYENGDCKREYTQIDLGKFVVPEEIQ